MSVWQVYYYSHVRGRGRSVCFDTICDRPPSDAGEWRERRDQHQPTEYALRRSDRLVWVTEAEMTPAQRARHPRLRIAVEVES